MRARFCLLVAVVLSPLVLWSVLPVGSLASNPSAGQIQGEINHKKALIGGHKAHERVLTTQVTAFTDRIDALQSDISRLSSRQQSLQSDLDAKRARLETIQQQLRAERQRLTRLRARLVVARRALAVRLVALYEGDEPDLVSVVLNSEGFADLLERTEFLERISHQDTRIVGTVKAAKADATSAATRLAALQSEQTKITDQIESRRDQVASARSQVVGRRDRLATARRQKQELIASSRDRRAKLEDDVAGLESQQRKIQAKLARAAAGGSFKAVGGGRLIWPVNGPITSPFCESRPWEACHPGIDIGVPLGTPIHAAAAGKVVLMQTTAESGGYGNYTCIQHTATLSTCYGHQSRFATSVGAEVAQGQVIGYTGCTGRCTGPHLHFETRINGAVVNPLNYL